MLPEDLFAHLDTIEHTGRFVASGWHEQAPLLAIDGLGTLPLPVVPLLLPALHAAGTPAPYGRGPDTLVDPEVRRCHQVDAGMVTVPASFATALGEITREAASLLGVVGEVEAHLYKLLVYGPGDFFVPHRDTEKEPGMFGTLVLTLPGDFTGGELVVRHGDLSERISVNPGGSGVRWFAFYADCSHEVLPLDTGARVALVYNLVREGAPTGPAESSGVVAALARELRTWESGSPVKLAWALEHRYSEAELDWDRLKGADQGRAEALRRAAAAAGVTAHLAQLAVDVEWSAEELQYRSRRRRRGWGRWGHTLEDDEVPGDIELWDRITDGRFLRSFVDANGEHVGLDAIPVEEGEVWPEGVIDDEPPDHVSYHEATGNEGATLTQMYRRAVVVLWPADAEDALLAQCGLDAVVSALPDIRDIERVESLVEDVLHETAHGRAETVTRLLAVLVERGLGELGARVVERRVRLESSMVAALSALLEVLDEARAGQLASHVMARLGPWDGPVAVGVLAAAAWRARHPRLWKDLGAAFAVREPGHGEDAAGVAVIVDAAWRLEHDGLQRSALSRLDEEVRFDLGVAAALALQGEGRLPDGWRVPVVEGLTKRVAVRPVAPRDLARDPVAGCHCEDCRVLSDFLREPSEDRFSYGVRKDRRRHLQRIAAHEKLDVTTREIKTGSPHKIVFTKTTGRFERARDRFARHVEALAKLGDAGASD